MNKLGFLLISLTASLLVLPAQAEVYRQVDEQGNVTYTDDPDKGAEKVEVKPVTTITMPKPETVRKQLEENGEELGKSDIYNAVSFVSPSDDQAFHSGSGNIEFQVTSEPPLRPGHRYEVTLDGQPVGQTGSGSVTVENVYRGTHRAGVHVINGEGERIHTGDQISFTIHRPSVLN